MAPFFLFSSCKFATTFFCSRFSLHPCAPSGSVRRNKCAHNRSGAPAAAVAFVFTPCFRRFHCCSLKKPRFLHEPTARIQSILISSFRLWMPSGRSPGEHPPRRRRRGARFTSSRRAGSSRRAKLRLFLAPSHPRRRRRVARRAWLDARRLRAPRARQAPGRVCRRGAGRLGRRKVVVAPRGGCGRGAPWRRRAGVVLRFPDRAGLPGSLGSAFFLEHFVEQLGSGSGGAHCWVLGGALFCRLLD